LVKERAVLLEQKWQQVNNFLLILVRENELPSRISYFSTSKNFFNNLSLQSTRKSGEIDF
jgi:hypothetical protein